jgi:hypothetical protein
MDTVAWVNNTNITLESVDQGHKWVVPLNVVARSHAEYYKDVDEVNFEIAYQDTCNLFFSNPMDIEDWLTGDMRWEEIAPFIEKFIPNEIDHADLFPNVKIVDTETIKSRK